MSLTTSLTTLANYIDPRLAYWSVLLRSGKEWNEHTLIPTFKRGVGGVRLLDWGEDIVTTGDVHRVKELRLHCPDGRVAIMEIAEGLHAPFQFKTRSFSVLMSALNPLEYMVVGRVTDKATGECDCYIWDYQPAPGQPNLIAYKSNIQHFGSWRESVTPMGALSHDVQGFRL